MTEDKAFIFILLAVLLRLTYCLDTITTIAGSSALGYSGDDGQATSAALSSPCGVTLDSSGF